MKKYIKTAVTIGITALVCLQLLTGCSVEKKNEKKIGDIEFSVVPEEMYTDELKQIIDERKKEMFKTTFADKDSLYIIIGYGAQPTGGYSIGVRELYESKNGIYIKTEFIGPAKNEDVIQTVSYPYIVVKIEYIDKSVIFK